MKLELRTDIDALKLETLANIDAQTEEVRGLFLTLGSAQSMVYAEKRLEADAYLANPALPPTEIPHLVAEAQVLGVSVQQVAANVAAMAVAWRQVSPVIEAIRLRAKERTRTATTANAVRASAVIDWDAVKAIAPPK